MKSCPPNTAVSYLSSAFICALTAVIAIILLPYVDLANIVMLFLLAVFLISVYLGRGTGILAAFLSVALFDFFCVAPRFTFAVDDIQYLLTFAVMLAVALITGQLAANLREQAKVAKAREQRTMALYEMARALSGTLQLAQVCEITATFLRKITGLESVLLLPDKDTLTPAMPHQVKYEVHMAWAAYDNKQQQLLTEPDGLYYLPLKGTTRMRGVLVVASTQNTIDGPPILTDEDKALLTTVASLVAIAIERLHYVDVAKQGELQIATERLRSSILSALSHDLRTPLTVLVGMADSLLISKPALSDKQKATALTLVNQSNRLCNMVANLLDMARLHAGKVNIHKEWQPLEEVIGASIQMLEKTLEEHPVKVSLPDDLPVLEFDAVLMERVFCNLLENAAKYSQRGDAIEISAQVKEAVLCVSVCDNGCGISPEKCEVIFGMFVRGQGAEEANKIAGTGIGLAVCKAIIEAHQGVIMAENRPSGGTCILFTLPLGEPPILNESMLVEDLT
jgi:two-component system sensor histidine kinase KdpD